MEIKFRKGSRIKGDALTVYTELERIRIDNNGKLTPDSVVSESKNPSSPLHDNFEWNGRKAAHQWRLCQARAVIRSIEIIRIEAPHVHTRAYEVRTEAQKPGIEQAKKVYQTIDDILADPVARAELMGNAITDAIAFRKRYAALSELATVFREVDSFLDEVV